MRRVLARRLLLLIVLLGWAAAAPAALGGPIGCPDARGCPDLVVDGAFMAPVRTVELFPEDDCAVVEGMVEPGVRSLVRFNFATPNVGSGDLVVGSPWAHREWFEWSWCHGHYHFKEYADYRLWTMGQFEAWDAHRQAHPDQTPAQAMAATGLAPVEGRKQGFCVMDVLPYPFPGSDPVPRHPTCDDMGITRGWADVYHLTLDGQWVDVTGLPPGVYVLEAEVNAERFYTEESYANNRAWTPVAV